MARAATSADVFNAIAETGRRAIIEALARHGQMTVGALAARLRLPQPAVSKRLGVLREVGLVTGTREGRRRLYSLEAGELRAVHEWTGGFERLWTEQLTRIKARAERAAASGALVEPAPSADRSHRPDEEQS